MPIGTLYADLNIKLKEDVLDLLIRLTPTDTPVMQMFGDSEVDQPFHGWNREELTVRQDNAIVEGAAFGFTAEPIGAVRETNVTQILKKEVRISRTSQKSSRYGVANQYADQVFKRLIEFKTDLEHALVRGSLASGNASSVRRLRGVIWSLTLGSLQHTTMSEVSFAESHLNDLLQALWDRGAKARDLLVNGNLARRVSQFTGSPAQTKFRDQNDLTLINLVSVYESDFGVVRKHISRDIPQALLSLSGQSPGSYVIAVDRSMFKKAWLDRPFTKRTADVADSLDGVVIGELTLEYGHPDGGGFYAGLL